MFDVSGAGDTVVAMLAACIAAGIRHEDALSLANMAAGVVVRKSGTAVVSPGELITAAGPAGGPAQWQQATEICAAWQKDGQRVGFTNGCFDLLHPGHLTLLASAASQADRLIVGALTNDSLKKKKNDISTVLINSNFSCGFFIDRFKLYETICSTANVEIIYFPYTKSTSSTKLRDVLQKLK